MSLRVIVWTSIPDGRTAIRKKPRYLVVKVSTKLIGYDLQIVCAIVYINGILLILLVVVILLAFAGVCAGLNISLMSLSISDLKRKAKIGDKRAKKVLPLRKNIHLSMAGILFTNIATNTAVAIFLNQFLIGVLAGFISTILLVIFGEIIPQAIFSHNALKLCARFSWLIRFMIMITYLVNEDMETTGVHVGLGELLFTTDNTPGSTLVMSTINRQFLAVN